MPNVEITGLFPTPFMQVEGLLDARGVHALVKATERAELERNAKSELLSHTPIVDPETNPLFDRLRAAIAPLLVDFGELLLGERLSWTAKEVWMNVLEPGGHQALHAHANSFISGVLYLTDTHASARTILYRDLGGRDFTFSNDGPETKQGPFNSKRWAVPAQKPGDLVLFPSYLLHEVPRNQGERRLTLAFNAIPERVRSWGYELRFSPAR